MDDLHLVGLTEDGDHLVLSGAHGEQFRLPLDDRLLAAIRGDLVRLGQLHIELESQLRPAEIQARIRAGASAEQVALAAGIPVARVRRYEGPVLAEREHIAGLARRTPARRRGDGFVPALGDLVEQRLHERGPGAGTARWDACRRDDATWAVSVTVGDGGADQLRATWAFDPRRGLLTPEDDEALRLSAEEPLPAPATPATPAERGAPRRLASVPRAPRTADAGPTVDDLAVEPSDDPDVEPDVELPDLGVGGVAAPGEDDLRVEDSGDESSEELAQRPGTRQRRRTRSGRPDDDAGRGDPGTRSPAVDAGSGDDEPAEEPPVPARPTPPRPGPARHSSRGRRASVPAWDDIVFGTRPKE